MKTLIYIYASSLLICALGGCSPQGSPSNDVADAGESPAASLTAEEAEAYASYTPNLSFDGSLTASESAAGSK
jgi:PBP1b-binding outer membrane lipoprotein LpoB